MAHYGEIEESVNIIKLGSENIAVLHCISGILPPSDLNLATIVDLRNKLNLITDFLITQESMLVAATTYGAKIIEKHLTDTRDNNSADKEFSIVPSELPI